MRYFHVCPEARVVAIPGELDADGNPKCRTEPIPNRRDERPLPPDRDGKPQLDARGNFLPTAAGLGRAKLPDTEPGAGADGR